MDTEVAPGRRRGRKLEVVEGAAEPLLDPLANTLGPDVVDHELEPCLDARDAVAQVLAPLVQDRDQDGDGLVLRHPDAELTRDPRHGRQAAADEYAEALLAVPERADEPDAVDLRSGAAVGARGDRDLVLAREVRIRRVAVEKLRGLPQHRRWIEQLVVRQPR